MISLPREERESGIPPVFGAGNAHSSLLPALEAFSERLHRRATRDQIIEGEDPMRTAVLTFDGFNELDSFVASAILNRVKLPGWKAEITSPTPTVTSMNGVRIERQN